MFVFCQNYESGESSCEVKTEADSNDQTEHSHHDKPRPCLSAVDGKQFTSGKYIHGKRQTVEKLYSCIQCEKRYSSSGGLRQHMNIHRGKYKCTECGRCCGSQNDLDVHRRSHSGEKPYTCYTVSYTHLTLPTNREV